MVKHSYLFCVVGILLGGCGKASGPGPLDGTWDITAISCNGEVADPTSGTGAGSTIADGSTHSFLLANTTGTEVIETASCSVAYDLTLSYPSTNQINVAYSGANPTCTPADCDTTRCSTPKSGIAVYGYTATNLSTVTWTSGFGTDWTCVGATPYQDSPVVYTLTMQAP